MSEKNRCIHVPCVNHPWKLQHWKPCQWPGSKCRKSSAGLPDFHFGVRSQSCGNIDWLTLVTPKSPRVWLKIWIAMDLQFFLSCIKSFQNGCQLFWPISALTQISNPPSKNCFFLVNNPNKKNCLRYPHPSLFNRKLQKTCRCRCHFPNCPIEKMLGFCSSAGRGPRGPAPHLSITARLQAALQQSHLLKVCLVEF